MNTHRNQAPDLLTTEEVSRLIRRTRHYVQSRWREWGRWGVAPVRVGGRPGGGLLFRRSDIERLLDAWRVGT